MKNLIVAALVCLFCLSVHAEDKKPSKEQITILIEQLGDKQWKVRTKATQALIEIGKPAIKQLKAAAKSKDPEVAERAKVILVHVEKQDLEPLELRIVAPKEYIAAEAARRKKLGKKYRVPAGYRWVPVDKVARNQFGNRKEVLIVLDQSNWTIDKFDSFGVDYQNLQPVLSFSIALEFRKKFGEFTGKHVKRRMAIIMQGSVRSAPTIQSRIEGSGLITGLNHAELDYLKTMLRVAKKRKKPKK